MIITVCTGKQIIWINHHIQELFLKNAYKYFLLFKQDMKNRRYLSRDVLSVTNKQTMQVYSVRFKSRGGAS